MILPKKKKKGDGMSLWNNAAVSSKNGHDFADLEVFRADPRLGGGGWLTGAPGGPGGPWWPRGPGAPW